MNNKGKVLVVDDSAMNRAILSDILGDEYEVMEAANGREAMEVLGRMHSEIKLMFLDIVMPEMDGFEVLAAMNSRGWLDEVPVIIISSEVSSSYVDHAYDLGAVEYISRPFDEKMVKHRVENTIMLYTKQRELEKMVTDQILEKEKNNLMMVEILSHIVEFRNGESGAHVLHIRVITEKLLERLMRMTDKYDLSPERIALITNASALHDIGKIAVPEGILNKPGKLTPEEYNIMKQHSAAGAEMLEKIPRYSGEELVRVARDICRWHHERYDGRGYPDGLKGEEIPIAAQVVALADVYDALTSERVYKPAYSHAQAVEMILGGECGAFSPLLLDCLKESAPYLEQELKVRSAAGVSRAELSAVPKHLLRSGGASSRTLALLEQERTKYQFFASLSREIQFDYDIRSDVVTMSEYGASILGLREVISEPKKSGEVSRIMSAEDFADFAERIESTHPSDPVVDRVYKLKIGGEERWYRAVARPLWVGDDESGDAEMTGVIGKFIDVDDEQKELRRLKLLSQTDVLTGLFNREYAKNAADEALASGEGRYALLVIDFDDFHNVNTQRGHLFGDRVLKSVAERLRKGVRESDVVARVGGEEFLVFMRCEDYAEMLVKRVFDSIQYEFEGMRISASVGAAVSPENGSSYTELFHHADQAVYAAKQAGKARYFFYDESMKDMLSGAGTPLDEPEE